jgi:hypothetical protein
MSQYYLNSQRNVIPEFFIQWRYSSVIKGKFIRWGKTRKVFFPAELSKIIVEGKFLNMTKEGNLRPSKVVHACNSNYMGG